MPEDRGRVSVCLCTFKRPAMLDTLLARLAQQTLQPLEIVVVDNDPAHSACDILRVWAAQLPLKISHQPEPNIAKARNLAVTQASGDWLALIDDDELPGPDWLQTLVQAQKQSGADGVMAPVVATYTDATPQWMRQGGFFERRRFSTGTPIGLEDSRTGNVLLRADMVRSLTPPFDPDFGRSGGEDTWFFAQLHRAGYRFVWCDEAVVTEEVPKERSRARWILIRAYRGGQTYARVTLKSLSAGARPWRALRLALRAGAQLGLALLLAAACLPLPGSKAFAWLRTAAAQWGKLTALAGARYLEY